MARAGPMPHLHRRRRLRAEAGQVRVYDFKAPPRAYPGDRYTVTGFVQGQGLAGQTVEVESAGPRRRGGQGPAPARQGPAASAGQSVALGGDGEVVPVKFELTPGQDGPPHALLPRPAPAGRPRSARQVPGSRGGGRRSQEPRPAAGRRAGARLPVPAARCSYRDRTTTLDVLLQSAEGGISQEAQRDPGRVPLPAARICTPTIASWPSIPVWQGAAAGPGRSAGELGGRPGRRADRRGRAGLQRPDQRGLGPGPRDGQDPQPLSRSSSTATCLRRAGAAYAAKEPWPLEFTREGLEAEYLWLGDTAAASQQAWAGLPRRVQLLPGPRPEAGGHRPGPLLRSPHRPGRQAAGLFRRAVLRLGPGVLHGQRRDVAAPPRRSGLLRPVLHQAHPPRLARPAAAPVRRAACCWSARTATWWAARSRSGPS